ncbi:MAG: hypothetical protein JSR24_16275 [Proteobacteria bacterium]|nr:hypothetical protein [Pseudomonadota bacterium]
MTAQNDRSPKRNWDEKSGTPRDAETHRSMGKAYERYTATDGKETTEGTPVEHGNATPATPKGRSAKR